MTTRQEQEKIVEILKNKKACQINSRIVEKMINKIVDVNLIVDLACNSYSYGIRSIFLEKIDDKKIIYNILSKKNLWWCSYDSLEKAVCKIKDQQLLKKKYILKANVLKSKQLV